MSHNQLLHTLLHFGVHALHHYRHERHKKHAAEKAYAHRLSPLAGAAFDACELLGGHLDSLEADTIVFQYDGVRCIFAIEGRQPMTGSVCPVRFRHTTRELESLINARNSTLEYGTWGLINSDDAFLLLLQIRITRGAIDGRSFAHVAKYMQSEIPAMYAALQRAGFCQ